ncbi:hypothetical protein PG990_007420 [Apiospora arundinis]
MECEKPARALRRKRRRYADIGISLLNVTAMHKPNIESAGKWESRVRPNDEGLVGSWAREMLEMSNGPGFHFWSPRVPDAG